MSSESNGRKPDSEPGSSQEAARRFSARAASAWGAARDALAAVHNLEALLRGSTVPYRTILDLLPELRASAAVLRGAFDAARGGAGATSEVGVYGAVRVDEFGRLLDERSEAPVPTEVSLNLIVRETARMSGTGRGRELIVRFDEASPDCVVTTDPYAVGPLLAIAVARVHGHGVGEVVVRARCSPPLATLMVEAAIPQDAVLPMTAMRVLPSVAPTDDAARRVAERIGALLVIEPARWVMAVNAEVG
jgi:hypothetical protein